MQTRLPKDKDRPGPANLALLCLAALLAGLFLALPFGHQLFHEGGGEPENCPVRMVENSLVLLVLFSLTSVLLLACPRSGHSVPWSVPLPHFFRGYSFGNRAPPRT